MPNFKFIVLTGIDGAGKDFIANHLSLVDPGSFYMRTPTFPFDEIRNKVDAFTLQYPEAHYYFYLSSVIHASKIISEKLVNGNVYCSRYLIDTVVYHRAIGLSVALCVNIDVASTKETRWAIRDQ